MPFSAEKTYLQIFFERGNGILRFTELLQACGQSLDCVILILSLGRKENVVQLQQLKERLRSGIHVPAKRSRDIFVLSDRKPHDRKR